MEEKQLALEMVQTIMFKNGSKTAQFHLKMDHGVAPLCGIRLIEHPFAII